MGLREQTLEPYLFWSFEKCFTCCRWKTRSRSRPFSTHSNARRWRRGGTVSFWLAYGRILRSKLQMKVEGYHDRLYLGYGRTCIPPPNLKISILISINPTLRLPWLDSVTDYLYPDYTHGTLVETWGWRVWMDMGQMCIWISTDWVRVVNLWCKCTFEKVVFAS